MMVQLGALVGKRELALDIVNKINTDIHQIRQQTGRWDKRPKVYFEEWFDPLIFGIQWVSEIIQVAGGVDIFKDKRSSLAKGRILEDSSEVVTINPDVILASWCGKKFKKEKMFQRTGWQEIEAIKTDSVFEIKSEIILQPGPAALMEGLPLVHKILKDWQEQHG